VRREGRAAVHTRVGTKTISVSIGHRMPLETAIKLVLQTTRETTRGYRLLEPTRMAQRLASQESSQDRTSINLDRDRTLSRAPDGR
jgi:deoxyinosine 3'endonuclease (endonuclease V)